MSEVRVLLATYQGQRYLPDFLESLENQTVRQWKATVSDDGSSDGTWEILKNRQERLPDRYSVERNPGANGAKVNFAGLLERSGPADYYFFADQDDLWYANKMERVLSEFRRLEAMYGADIPMLVHSDLRLIDENGHELHPSMNVAQKLQAGSRRGLRHLLVQNNVTGCAMAINRSLRDLASPVPAGAIMHDWWLAIAAAAFGVISFIPEPLVGYRQHSHNVVGAKRYSLAHVLGRLGSSSQVRASLTATFEQAEAFLTRFEDSLPAEQREIVQAFATIPLVGPLERRRRILDHGFWKSGAARNMGLLLLV